MDQQQIIADIEARVKKAGLTMGDACVKANLHPTTFSRWKRSEKNPQPVNANLASLSRLQAVVAEAEATAPARKRVAA